MIFMHFTDVRLEFVTTLLTTINIFRMPLFLWCSAKYICFFPMIDLETPLWFFRRTKLLYLPSFMGQTGLNSTFRTFRDETQNNYPAGLCTASTVAAVRKCLLEIGEPLQGKDMIVIEYSKFFGTTLALMLIQSAGKKKNDLFSERSLSAIRIHI